jgi:hypothetical protein
MITNRIASSPLGYGFVSVALVARIGHLPLASVILERVPAKKSKGMLVALCVVHHDISMSLPLEHASSPLS